MAAEVKPFSMEAVANCVRKFGAAVLLNHPEDGPLFGDGPGTGCIPLDADNWRAFQQLHAEGVLLLRQSRFMERGTVAVMAPNMLQGWGWGT